MKRRAIGWVFVLVLTLALALPAYAETFPVTDEEAVAAMGGALGLAWSAYQDSYPDRTTLTLTGESSDAVSINLNFEYRDEAYKLASAWGTGLLFAQRILPDSNLKGVTQVYFDLCCYEDMLRMDIDLQSGSEKHNETCDSYRGFGDPAELEAFTLGFDVEELFNLMARLIEKRNEPIYIPSDGSDTALPQPQLAKFKGSKKYDVYTGPGGDYLREANGKATVSTNDWIQVFGEEDGWLLIQYNVSEGNNRFGWIRCAQETAGVNVPQLKWADMLGLITNAWVTNDPLRNSAEMDAVFGSRDGRLLATLGADWAYVETTSDSGKKVRAFVSSSDFVPGAAMEDLAQDQMYEIAWSPNGTPSYSRPEASEDAFLYDMASGMRVFKTGEENGFAEIYEVYDDFRNTVFISNDALVPVESSWPMYDYEMTEIPSCYIAQENTVLYAQPGAESAPIATLVRGMDVRVLSYEDGWCFVDAWCRDGAGGSNLRGYARSSAVEEGWADGQTHPIMRIEPPDGKAYPTASFQYLSGTEMVLRAVSADGQYGVGMVDLRLPCISVPMEYLVDTGKRGEWNFEAMGHEGTLVADEGGATVAAWWSSENVDYSARVNMEFEDGQSVTVLAINNEAAQIVLPGTTEETYFVRARNVSLRE